MKHSRFRAFSWLLCLLLALSLLLSSCDAVLPDFSGDGSGASSGKKSSEGETIDLPSDGDAKIPAGRGASIDLSEIPAYGSSGYYAINGNKPAFASEELTKKSYEYYSPLDELGRCGYAVACVGKDLMPADGETRGSIGSVTPSGWVQVSYPSLSLPYLYNRSHIIGWQLTAENANEKNLITGTRYMNTNMISYENMIADYVKETGQHVLYRVEPIYDGDDLVASGLHMEAYSVEDGGYGVSFNVYLYNVQPGVTIDYATGASVMTGGNKTEDDGKAKSGEEETQDDEDKQEDKEEVLTYYVNTSTKKFHLVTCRYHIGNNITEMTGTRSELIEQGYSPCGICKP